MLYTVPLTPGSAIHHVIKVYPDPIEGQTLVMTRCQQIATTNGTTNRAPESCECAACYMRSQRQR